MIAYIFKSSLSLILLFGLYWFLLRKEKLFIFNRFFLILSVIFSLILPFVSIPVKFQTTQELKNIIPTTAYIIPEISTSENIISQDIQIEPSSVEEKPAKTDISTILVLLYISGAILFLLRFLKNIYTMYRQVRLSEKIRFVGYRLILTSEKSNPYCFFNNIFLNRNDYLNGRIDNDLLNHELMHITQYHSVDIIFLELIKIFYWFNPVYLLYDRAIRINHEYLADHGVIHDDYDIKNYSDKLLSLIFRRSNIPLASGSNHSFTKKRLLMMTRTKSKSSVYGIRIAITLSVIVIFSLFLSFKLSNRQLSNDEQVLSGLTDLQAQTVKDIDGNEYKTVTIGNQVWMAENLKTTRYNDGKEIPMITDDKKWQKYDPAFCWYNNEAENKNKYGALYNWYTVNTNMLCPKGWHVPNKKELASSINLWDTITGGKLKEAGSIHWKIPNIGATNESGFTALPGGIRTMDGEYIRLGEQAWWWTSGEENEYIGSVWTLQYNNSSSGLWPPSKRTGCSVRCIKDNIKGTSNSSINNGDKLQNVVRGIDTTKYGITLSGETSKTTLDNQSKDGASDKDDVYVKAEKMPEYPGGDVATKEVLSQDKNKNEKTINTIIVDSQKISRNFQIKPYNFNPISLDGPRIIVIDGKVSEYGFDEIEPKYIQSLSVVKGEKATSLYGNKNANAVIIITTKRAANVTKDEKELNMK